MRKSVVLILTAALGLSALIFAGEFSPASARPPVTLSQCIANYWSCRAGCWNPDSPFPPGNGVGYCYSNCWNNHATCVDRAFSNVK